MKELSLKTVNNAEPMRADQGHEQEKKYEEEVLTWLALVAQPRATPSRPDGPRLAGVLEKAPL